MIGLNKKIFLILLLGLLFRFFIIFCLPVRTFENTIKRYHYTAINLIEGRGYSHFDSHPYEPSFYKPPVYPLFLAVIYKIFGVNINAVKIIQALLDTMGCLLLFYLASHYFNEKASFVVLFFSLFFPITAVYTNVLNPESLTLFLMILSLWMVSKAVLTGRGCFFLGAGLSTILMAYSRQEFTPFILIFGAYLFIIKKKKIFVKMVLYCLAIIILMTPWAIRNYNLTQRFIPFSAGDGLGFTLWYATLGKIANDVSSLERFFQEHPQIKRRHDEWYKTVLYSSSNLEEKCSSDQFFMKLALDNIRKNPIKYLTMRLTRVPRVWINLHADEFTFLNSQKLRLLHPDFKKIVHYAREDIKEVLILLAKYLFFTMNLFYLLMAIIGFLALRKEFIPLSFMFLPLIYAQVFFLFFHESPNYAIPYWPCIIFFSGIGFYYLWQRRIDFKKEESIEDA